MKKCTKPLNRLSLTLLLICFVWFAKAQTATFPFPQNYNYAYGIKATISDPTIIQARFAEWKAKYYVESGTHARIKYQVLGEDGSATLSEDIGYGMLIMLYMDNTMNQSHACFDKLYNYYKANLDANGLMNAKTNAFTGNVLLANSVSSADIDVAQALLLADKQWGSAGTINYLSDASSLIQKIWTYETQAYNGSQIVKTSDNSSSLINPSYSIINAFKLFSTNDINSSHNWLELAKKSYSVINKTANVSTGLVPDWAFPDGSLIGVGSNVGDACASIANAESIACDLYQSYFLYDAVKTPWRMAQAYAWYGDVDAKIIAGAIANWSNTTFSGDPSNAFDGYNLDGTVISGLTTSGFTTKGKYHNALFAGCLGISGMVDAQYQNFVNTTWTYASISEGANSQSSTATPQLLLLLLMSGNMPNFLDLNPSPVKAYNNSTGGCNTIFVSFNKALNASSVTASTSSWSVTTNNASTPITFTVNSVALSNDGKTLALSLAAPIEEPLIQVSYSAISKISSVEGKMLDAFTNLSVEDVNECARAFPIHASTNINTDTLRIVFSKSMLASSFVLSDFLVKVNETSVTPLAVFADVNDPTLLVIKIGSGIATSTSKITVSYTKGSLKSLDGGSPNSFSDFTVTNAIPCGCCETIETFEPLVNTWTTWFPGSMSTTTTDPVGTSVVGKFTKGYSSSSSNQYLAVKGDLPKTTISDSTLNARMLKNAVLKMRVYVSKAGAPIRVRLQDRYKGTSNAYATSIERTCTVAKANTWTNVAFDFSSLLPTTTNLNEIQIDLEPDIAISVSETMYFDDIRLCPVSATTKIVHGNTSIDGSQIKLECNTQMSVPTNFTDFTIVPSNTITSIVIDPNDNKSFILNMATPFTQTDAITISYSGNTVIGLNGLKLLPFSNLQIVNLMGRTVTNGWIDNFNVDNTVNSVDVTQNIGGDNLYTRVENISGIGTYSVTAKASTINSGDYNSWGPNVSPVSSAEVWDISADPVVRFSVAVPAGETVYVRADVVDLVNNRATDGLLPIKLIADGLQHSYTIDFTYKLENKFSNTPGPVDAKNIVTVNLYQWKNDTYTPKLWTGTAVYDWLSVGSTIKIYNTSTDTVALETNAHATSSADGEIYLVPSNTARAIETLKDVVSKGLGVKVTAAKDVAVSIPTTNLTKGSYIMYAFNPSNNDLSRQSNEIQIKQLSLIDTLFLPSPNHGSKYDYGYCSPETEVPFAFASKHDGANNGGNYGTFLVYKTATSLVPIDTLVLTNNNIYEFSEPPVSVTAAPPTWSVWLLDISDSVSKALGRVKLSVKAKCGDCSSILASDKPLTLSVSNTNFCTTGQTIELKSTVHAAALGMSYDFLWYKGGVNPANAVKVTINTTTATSLSTTFTDSYTISYGDIGLYTLLVRDHLKPTAVNCQYTASVFITASLAPVYTITGGGEYKNGTSPNPVIFNFDKGKAPYYCSYVDGSLISHTVTVGNSSSVNPVTFTVPETIDGTYKITALTDADNSNCDAVIDTNKKATIFKYIAPLISFGTCQQISLNDFNKYSVSFINDVITIKGTSSSCNDKDSIVVTKVGDSISIVKPVLTCPAIYTTCLKPFEVIFKNCVDSSYKIHTVYSTVEYWDTIVKKQKFVSAPQLAFSQTPCTYDAKCYVTDSINGGTINWYSDNTLTTAIATGNSFLFTPSAIGTYNIYATRTLNGKTSQAVTLEVIISKNPTIALPPPPDTLFVPLYKKTVGLKSGQNAIWEYDGQNVDTALSYMFVLPSTEGIYTVKSKFNLLCQSFVILHPITVTNDLPFVNTNDTTIAMNIGDSIDVLLSRKDSPKINWTIKNKLINEAVDTIETYNYDPLEGVKCKCIHTDYTVYTIKAIKTGIDTLVWEGFDGTTYYSKRIICKVGTQIIQDTCPKIAIEAVNIRICTPEKSVPECWGIQYHCSYLPQGVEAVDTLYTWAQYNALEVGTHTVDFTVVFNNACNVKVSNTVNVTQHQTPKFPTIHEFNYDSNAVKTLYLDSIPNSNCIVSWHRDGVDYGIGNSVLVPFDSIGTYMIYITLTDTVEKCSSIGNTYLNIKDTKLPSLSGTVNADGNPFSNGTIQLFEQNGADYTAVAADSIHIDGTFTFKWLKTTKYLIRALPSASQTSYLPSYYVNALQWQDATVIDLKGKIIGLDLALVPSDVTSSGAGSISGAVDLQDTSFVSKQKALYLLQMTVIVMKDGNVVSYGLTDFEGNYTINNLSDGIYDVYVEMPGYSKWSQSVSITNGSSSQAFFTLKKGEITSMTDVSANTDEVIYPNPANSNISIRTNKTFNTIQIVNIDGVVVFEKQNPEKLIAIACLSSGFYVIKLISDNQTIIKTFVKQ